MGENHEATSVIKCPRCDGQGHTIKPPWIPGDVTTWVATETASHACPSCTGSGLLTVPNRVVTTLRDYLAANLFDGDDAGSVTQPIAMLLDDVCENVTIWLIEQSGVSDAIDRYYTAPIGPKSDG